MDWNAGYTVKYYLTVVDINTWKDISTIQFTDGSIKREYSGLMQSADFTCPRYTETKEQLVRVWLDTYQNGGSSHTPLFTGYASSPSRDIEGRLETRKLQCYSVLKPAQDILLERGWYAPVGIDGTLLIKDLLRVTKTPVDISTKVDEKDKKKCILTLPIVAESGETNLSMVEKILSTINWRMKVNGFGEISIEPYSDVHIATFDATSNDIIEPSLSINNDWYECPNVLRVVVDDKAFIARDDDEDSIMSTISRGREIWAEENSPSLNDGEGGQEYAERRLKELQRVATTVSYDRRFVPDVYPTDVVYLNYPSHSLVGKYFVASQSITLGVMAKTSEEVIKL